MEHTKQWVKENDPYGEEFVDINQSCLEQDGFSEPIHDQSERKRWEQILSGISVNKKGNISFEEFKEAALYVNLDESIMQSMVEAPEVQNHKEEELDGYENILD
jgi:hypothetical protein